MAPPTCLRGLTSRIVVAVVALCLAISVLIGQEPHPTAKQQDLTPEQQEKLKERDRLKAEVEKFRKEEKWAEAVVACEKQLAVEREVWGDLHDDVVTSLNKLADLHDERDDWPAAKKQREEVLRIQTKRYGVRHWRAVDSRRAVAVAEKLARMSTEDRLDLEEESRLDREIVRLRGQGKFIEATPLCRKALDIRERVLGPEHPLTAVALNNLGHLLHMQGNYAAAQPYHRRALAIRQSVLGPEHPETAQSLNNLGFLLHAQGDYRAARHCYDQALAIREKVMEPNHPDIALCLNNLGGLLEEQGDYSAARPYWERACKIRQEALGPTHSLVALSLNNLGYLLYAQNDFAGARPLYEQALEIRRKVLGSTHPDTAQSLNNLGHLLLKQAAYEEARPYFDEALAIHKKLLGAEHPLTAGSLSSLGVLLYAQGDYSGAQSFHEMAESILKKANPEHRDRARTLANLGHVRVAQEDHIGAREYYSQALAAYQQLSERFSSGASEVAALNFVANFPPIRDAFLSLTRRLAEPGGAAYAAIWNGESIVTRVLERRHHDVLANESDPGTRQLWLELLEVRRQLSRAILNPSRDRNQHADKLKEFTDHKERLERELASKLSAFGRSEELKRRTPVDLVNALPADIIFVQMVSYLYFEKLPAVAGPKGQKRTPSYVAFVMKHNQPVQRVELGPAEPIDRTVREWRHAIGRREYSPAPEALRRMLWEHLTKHIPDTTSTVILAPDGDLHGLPWAALPGRKPNTLLLEDHAIAIGPHGHFLLDRLTPMQQRDSTRVLMAVGGVQYDVMPEHTLRTDKLLNAKLVEGNRLLRSWKYLEGTSEEVDQIVRLASERRTIVYKNTDASATRVLPDLPKARWAHLATHGFFADAKLRSALRFSEEDFKRYGSGERAGNAARSPLVLSGLVLAGANLAVKNEGPEQLAGDDGILTAEMIVGLSLGGLELAVLSACESGVGEEGGGEGVFGLQRAFHLAGTHTVIASLWKVPDRATQMLMTRFYENLWQMKMSKLEALRQAQIWMLREVPKDERLLRDIRRDLGDDKPEAVKLGDGPLPPYYWAGFALSGDWR